MTDFPARTYAPDTHRALPQSPDGEKGVLASILISPRDVIGLCVEKRVSAAHFQIPAHATIYEHLLAMESANDVIDFITLTQRLRDQGVLDQCGGAAFITDLFTFIPTAANAAFYIEIVEEKYCLSQIVKVCTQSAGEAYEAQDEPWGLLDRVEENVLGIRTLRKSIKPSLRNVVVGVLNKLQDAHDRKGQIGGLTTGFPEFDALTDGLHAEEMIVIAARPSHGKSALAMNIVEWIALEQKKPVAVFSLEMSTEQLVQRMMCSRAKINYFRWRDGFAADRDFPALQSAASHISGAPIFIEDQSGQSIQEIRAIARRLRADKKIEAVFIDYLQLVRSSTKRAQENRTIEVGEISNGCKNLARELGIPVVVLAQIDRSVEKQQRKPRLSDLRESGAIEQDADVVAFLTRDELYAEDEEQREQLSGMANLSVSKSRHGPLGDVPLTFIKEFSLFETRAREYAEEEQQPQLPIR